MLRDSFFDSFATWLGELNAGVWPALEDFDAIVGVWVVRSGNVDSEIEAHFVKTIIDGWSWEYANGGVFEAERFEGGFEVGDNPFGRFAGVATEEDFFIGASVVGEAGDD